MRAAALPSARARAPAATGWRKRRGVPSIVAASAAARPPPLALARRQPRHESSRLASFATSAASTASTSQSPPSSPSAENPRPPSGTAAAYGTLAAAHAAAALALAALSLLPAPNAGGAPLLTACLALGPASTLMAPALGVCLAAASVRAAGLSLFVRGAAAAAEGVTVVVPPSAARRPGGKASAAAAAATTKAADASDANADAKNNDDDANSNADDDNDVTAIKPLPTELRTWRYQRPNAALAAFGALSVLAHALGLATALPSVLSGASPAVALALPLAGIILSSFTTLVAARALKWAAVDANNHNTSSSNNDASDATATTFPAASGSLAGVSFACEPLAEAMGGAEDSVEDRRIVAAELEIQRQLETGLRVTPPRGPLPPPPLPALPPRQPDPLAAARVCLAHLARDITTFQGLALTLTWVSSLGCFALAVGASLLPWPRALPAVLAAAAASASASCASSSCLSPLLADPALAYLLAAAGVAHLPTLAAHAHALCEHAAYTRRLDVPGTLRASLLARLTRVARRRRVRRGREARGLVVSAVDASSSASSAVVEGEEGVLDVRLDGDEEEEEKEAAAAAAGAAAEGAPTSNNNKAPLFPPPPHNAPASRFGVLRASFAAATALQLLGLVGVGASGGGANGSGGLVVLPFLASSSSALAPAHLSDPRFLGAQAAARAALDAFDPVLAALTWAALLGLLWGTGQAFGFDFKKARGLVVELAQLASRVIDLVVRGLFWDAYWVMQNRVVH